MHRPAPAARPFPQLRFGHRALSGDGGGRRPSLGLRIASGLVVFFTLLWLIVAYTPIAHPRDLQVEGATGISAERIKAAITEEASGQSTFRVSEERLMAAVARYPEVAEIKIASHPPFRLDLTVVMRPPVGRAEIGGRQFTVAGDGTVLERANEAAVPKLDPSLGSLVLRDGRLVGDGGGLRVLGAAPDTLLDMIRTLRRGDAGLEVELSRGPRLIFGSADGAASKWAAASAVIADGAATRATYIDVRVPGRPAVGGLGGSKTAGADDPPSLIASDPAAGATVTGAGTTAAPADSAAAEEQAEQAAASGTATPPASQAPATGTGAGTGAAAGSGTPAGSGTAPQSTGTSGTDQAQTGTGTAPASGTPGAGSTGGATGAGGVTP